MLDQINNLDTKLFLYLNSLHDQSLDILMLALSYNKLFMLLLISTLVSFGIYYFKKSFLIAFLFCLLTFGLSDVISSKGFKDNFKRLRPCHQEHLANKVHLAGKKCWGGKYGFLSSHASNSFAIAMFFWLLFRKKSKWFALLFIHAGMVSYSRVYLARHFPLDIICGAILGMTISYLVFQLYLKLLQKQNLQLKDQL
jgi:undecaprenyl-diphosphatase